MPVQIDLRAKMLMHLQAAERWQHVVSSLEEEASKIAATRKTSKSEDFVASKILSDSFRYKQATGNRDAHQRQVMVYSAVIQGLAAAPHIPTIPLQRDSEPAL